MSQPLALIVGAGSGLSASLARLFAGEGMNVVLSARDTTKLATVAGETKAKLIAADATDAAGVASLFEQIDTLGPAEVVVYNPSYRIRGAIEDIDPVEVKRTLDVTVFGGFLVAQAAAQRMLRAGRGTILFTGASASVKGYPRSSPFAMGKFALRGLAQSLARELHPKNIHVAHIVIDGAIRNPGRTEPGDRPDSMLDPDAIAQTYLHLVRQHRSAWAWEIELRPWVESF